MEVKIKTHFELSHKAVIEALEELKEQETAIKNVLTFEEQFNKMIDRLEGDLKEDISNAIKNGALKYEKQVHFDVSNDIEPYYIISYNNFIYNKIDICYDVEEVFDELVMEKHVDFFNRWKQETNQSEDLWEDEAAEWFMELHDNSDEELLDFLAADAELYIERVMEYDLSNIISDVYDSLLEGAKQQTGDMLDTKESEVIVESNELIIKNEYYGLEIALPVSSTNMKYKHLIYTDDEVVVFRLDNYYRDTIKGIDKDSHTFFVMIDSEICESLLRISDVEEPHQKTESGEVPVMAISLLRYAIETSMM